MVVIWKKRCASVLHCHQFNIVWHLIRNWIGVISVDPPGLADHLIQFTQLCGSSKVFQSLLQLIWFTVVWIIWKERTNRIFKPKVDHMHILLDKIKLLSFEWLKAENVILTFN